MSLSPAAARVFAKISIFRPLYRSDDRCELAEVRGEKYKWNAEPAWPVSRTIAAELINSGQLHRLKRDGEGERGGYAELDILDADKGEIYVHVV